MKIISKTIAAILLSLTMIIGFAGASSAAEAPTAYPSATIYTDTLPTTVTFARYGNGRTSRVLCIGVKTGAGHTRSINIWNGRYRVVANYRQGANRTVGCTGHTFYATSRYAHVQVTEDLPGPWNITTRKYIKLW